MPPETPTVTFIGLIVRRGLGETGLNSLPENSTYIFSPQGFASRLRDEGRVLRQETRETGPKSADRLGIQIVRIVRVVGLVRICDYLFQQLCPGGSCRDLTGGNLFLGYSAGLVGAGINQWLGTILKLPGAAGCHDHVAKIAVNSVL